MLQEYSRCILAEVSSSYKLFYFYKKIQNLGSKLNVLGHKSNLSGVSLRTCLDATVPFHSPVQTALLLLFLIREEAIFTTETVTQWKDTHFTKQALSLLDITEFFFFRAVEQKKQAIKSVYLFLSAIYRIIHGCHLN